MHGCASCQTTLVMVMEFRAPVGRLPVANNLPRSLVNMLITWPVRICPAEDGGFRVDNPSFPKNICYTGFRRLLL